MGVLPTARLGVGLRPFTYTGVDLFGPVDVTVGYRRKEKRWGVLFVCLTVKASDSAPLQIVSRTKDKNSIMNRSKRNFRSNANTPNDATEVPPAFSAPPNEFPEIARPRGLKPTAANDYPEVLEPNFDREEDFSGSSPFSFPHPVICRTIDDTATDHC